MEGQVCLRAKRLLEKDPESLSLDGTRVTQIGDALGELLAQQPRLRALSLASCRLRSLEGLMPIPSLRHLNLSDNTLTDKDIPLLLGLESLGHLILSGNRFASVDALTALSALRRLSLLFVEGCPVEKAADLRPRLFKALPALKILNAADCDGNEVSYAESDDGESEEENDSQDDFIDDAEEGEGTESNAEEGEGSQASSKQSYTLQPRPSRAERDSMSQQSELENPVKKVNQ